MTATPSTSVRLPADLRGQFDQLARLTGRTRNELIITAMTEFAELQMCELAMIQEGFDQIERGESIALDGVVADFAARGMLDRDAYERDREQLATT